MELYIKKPEKIMANKRAFTLVELLMVIVIIALVIMEKNAGQ
jgi:prepilin-type N-terminal cleavage/methylation domain-containing protein